MRDLKSIEEEFVILNRYKDMLNKEKETTKDEEGLKRIDKDINAVDELMKELQIEVNKWANNYNKKDEEPIIEKTTREKFEENKKKIQDIKNQSKSLEPNISGVDKTLKKQILISNGFIETETVDYRKILIHSSLVGKYYDLVKEQRILTNLLYEEYMKSKHEQEELISEPEEITIINENNNDNIQISENNNDNTQEDYIEKSLDEEITQEIDINDITKEVEEEKTIEEDIDGFDKDNFKIGETVTIVPNSKIYISEDGAMFEKEEDMQNSNYNNSDDKRVILGVSISKDNKLYQICACTKNFEEKIQSLLNNGGKIESVLTGNIDRIERLKQFDGKYMSAEDINNLAEGWYNANSIIKNNEKGRFR